MTQGEAVALVAAFINADMRAESLFALKSAAEALSSDGIGGALVIKIPRKGHQTDVQFTTGQAGIKLEF